MEVQLVERFLPNVLRKKKYTFAQSFVGNMLSTEISHIQDVICKGRLKQPSNSNLSLTPKCRDVHFWCKKQADRSTSHPPSTLPPSEQFSPSTLITRSFVFRWMENKGRRLKAAPYFTPTSTKQFKAIQHNADSPPGLERRQVSRNCKCSKSKNFPYVWN